MNAKFIVGWREVVSLPQLGITAIKAKVDTGARTSCLHAFKLETFEKITADKNREIWVRFWIHPIQNDQETVKQCEAKVIDIRTVKDSGGHTEQRYVIESQIDFNQQQWPIEITLTNRETMLFRMLLGRTAMIDRMIVDPTASFLINSEDSAQ